VIYLIGSLKNPMVPIAAIGLRDAGFEVFDDWYSAGPEADDYWQAYEKQRGRSYAEALKGWHAKDVFAFDKTHLDRADEVVLVLPAGKSGHLELGYAVGKGKPGYILLDKEPERYDVMYQFATGIYSSLADLIKVLQPSA
jgi:nucleoside 2-deoxyribosyltransferase